MLDRLDQLPAFLGHGDPGAARIPGSRAMTPRGPDQNAMTERVQFRRPDGGVSVTMIQW